MEPICSRKRSGDCVDEVQLSPKRFRECSSPSTRLSIPLLEWSPEQVGAILLENNVSAEITKLFKDHNISGRHLLELSLEDLKEIGIITLGTRKDVLKIIKSLPIGGFNGEEKIFNDPIHGHIALHPLLIKIIDTPQFQRLRSIKQLGGGYYVFIGASHNRFEHSIGVGHLAGELVTTLQMKQPELRISYEDVLCVKIAGLCHDLGHGPFSHLFDNKFIPKIKPDTNWKHEKASVMMFDHLLKENCLKSDFERYGLNDQDITFIKEQIAGPNNSEMCSQPSDWPYYGRTEEKSFLYEIVANKRNGIDVDKWDYFARDCYYLGIPNNFDLKRYMKFARVIGVSSRRQICTRDKEVANLYEMFHTRISLHRRAYQHKTSKIIEYMITEALCKADEHLLIPGAKGNIKMSEAIEDPHAYTRLTDFVLQQIMTSTDKNLNESRELLLKVEKRQLYKFVGQTQRLQDDSRQSEDEFVITTEMMDLLTPDMSSVLKRDDLVVEVVSYDYGMKSQDPIEHVRFYGKENLTKAVKVRRDQVSQMLPHIFKEEKIRLYYKRSDQAGFSAARKIFMSWCQKHACITPKGSEIYRSEDDDNHDDSSLLLAYATPLKDTSGGVVNSTPVTSPLSSHLVSPEVKKKLQFALN